MALFDDRRFLVSHIRNSFVTGDDTGMCELVMLSDDAPPSELLQSYVYKDGGVGGALVLELEPFPASVEAPTEELGQSYDIVSELELLGAHRRRSNTAQRLERLKKERRQQARLRHVLWKEPLPRELTPSEVDQFFPCKDVSAVRNKLQTRTQGADSTERDAADEVPANNPSALSRQLEQFPVAPNNPFNEYARFDGRASSQNQKRINIFLSMLPPEERAYPLPVCPLPNAKVQDFIGLVCWQYTNEGREPKLRPGVGHYCLKIAEESGEIDEDFPSLDPKEPVSKFEFPYLALAQVERGEEEDATGPVVTFHTKDGFSKIQISSLECTLREVLDQMLKKRKGLLRSLGPEFHVESTRGFGIPIDLDTSIRSTGMLEFTLVSEDESPCESNLEDWGERDLSAIQAHLYQAFNVALMHRLGRSTEVQIGVSGEKVEITPLLHKPRNKFWSWHPKAATHNMNEIAACEIVDRKYSSEKRLLKIVYLSSGEFKHHLFEADYSTAVEIRNKLNYILLMRTSPARLQYMAMKEKKLLRKQSSFHVSS